MSLDMSCTKKQNMARRSIIPVAITILFLSTNCHQEAVVEQTGCGCEGKAAAVITDALARIPGDGIVFPQLMLKDAAVSSDTTTRYFILCNRSKIEGLATSKEGEYLYLVSGSLRPDCRNTALPNYWRMEISSIRKK